jgi:preprotein translocase subunit YajC
MQQYTTLIFIALLAVAFYFLILRPQRKRQQAVQQTMNALSPGNRVMLGSGVFGTVISVGARQVVLEISPGAELTVLKQAISRIATEDDEDSVEEHDELDEVSGLDDHDELSVQDTALEENAVSPEPRAVQPDRPLVEPPPTIAPEPVVKPESPVTRDTKPSTAE